MKNVYDIRYEKNLIYILPEKAGTVFDVLPVQVYAETAVIIYLYYIDTVAAYYKYIYNIPADIDIYIISSREEVLETVRGHMDQTARGNIRYIRKENRGRDVSALLVTAGEIIKNYQYICFIHDKKERSEETKEDTALWIENLWGNQLGSPDYIDSILRLFVSSQTLGLLVPPEPIGTCFNSWFGFGWGPSFDITKKLADRMGLHTDLRLDKPPITFGTVMWFRREALQKLCDFGWTYADFEDRLLETGDYLSYGVERIPAYVAQDAGYDTGTVMTVSYARKQTAIAQYTANCMLHEANPFFPISNMADLERYHRNRDRMVEFARHNEKVYLYGAGNMGRFCTTILRMENLLPAAYIVSVCNGTKLTDAVPTIGVDDVDNLSDLAVIITVYDEQMQSEIEDTLRSRGCFNYMKMWMR